MTEMERKNAITFKKNPLTLMGPELRPHDSAPDFKLLTNDLKEVSLSDYRGKTKVISVVPSLDTPVCDMQTRRFNQEAVRLKDQAIVLTVSMDLPFAQARWCGLAGAKDVVTLSDHRNASFGRAYGVLIKELRLLSRAVFIIDAKDRIQYAEYLKEITQPPDYEKALAALKL